MSRSNRRAAGGQMVPVIYKGIADVYIDFGIRFAHGVTVSVFASLIPAIEATGLFEIVGPVPVPEPPVEREPLAADEE